MNNIVKYSFTIPIKNLICPITRDILHREGDYLISKVSGVRYPIKNGIPCFTKGDVSIQD